MQNTGKAARMAPGKQLIQMDQKVVFDRLTHQTISPIVPPMTKPLFERAVKILCGIIITG